MPTITMPDLDQVRRGLKFGDVRDRADDARKTVDVGLPNIDWSKFDPSKFDLSKVDFSKLDPPARKELAKQIRKASKEQFSRASKELSRNLPGRGPSPLPFALLGAIGGLLIGWLIATTPAARNAVEGAIAGIRRSISSAMSSTSTSGANTDEPDLAAWTQETRTPVASDTYAAAVGAQREPVARESGVGVGPGVKSDELPSS